MMEKDNKDNSGDEKIVVRIKRKQEVAPTPLFSPSEVRRFVTEFVASWIRGDIIIRFPTAAELSKKTPFSIAFPVDPSMDAELKIKEHYVDLLSVCAGTKKASVEEQEKAVNDVFRMLLMFRSANRIEGKIISNDLEKRIEDLEKTVKSTSKLAEQITAFLFKPKKAKTTAKAKKSKHRQG
jgi:hypothetical protein